MLNSSLAHSVNSSHINHLNLVEFLETCWIPFLLPTCLVNTHRSDPLAYSAKELTQHYNFHSLFSDKKMQCFILTSALTYCSLFELWRMLCFTEGQPIILRSICNIFAAKKWVCMFQPISNQIQTCFVPLVKHKTWMGRCHLDPPVHIRHNCDYNYSMLRFKSKKSF